ncbi:helix-turn-helix domain-containing protein [Streptomyces sp. HPF1205]|uniref:AraC-like ligand-binding domain-containing protein n=1 Tax=Streptomyces sp. HPF1205 TaxID=2873262 RepID=UPI001CEC2A2B|nr:helix-turn-helix domain-containing protein [Streptomyces sp. HPF1205]
MIQTVYRSEDHPLSERFDAWQSITHLHLPMLLHPDDPRNFTATIRRAAVGAVNLTQLQFTPHRAVRDATMVRRSDPEVYVLALCVRGGLVMNQRRTDLHLRPGDLTLYDTSRPFSSEAGAITGGMTEALNLNIPKQLLPLPADKVDSLLATRLPSDQGLGAVVADTLRSIRTQAPYCTPADAARLGTVALDLVTALLSRHFDEDQPIAPESRQVALLTAIEDFIQRNLGDPALTPAAVADAHHISTRYLHRIFEQRDITVAALIRARRLDRCRRDLGDPGLAHVPIRAIAARWGFPQPGEFSRAFTKAYGTPPSAFRRAAFGPLSGGERPAVVRAVPSAVR